MKEIKIQTKNLGTIILRQISKEIAREMIVKNHYSHTWNEGCTCVAGSVNYNSSYTDIMYHYRVK